MRLLITDLDNTLYDWVTYFAKSFEAMTTVLVSMLSVEPHVLQQQFKTVHQKYGSSEVPYAALQIPLIQERFPNLTRSEVADALRPAFEAFSATRREHLHLYEGVQKTLDLLVRSGVVVVAHTEAVAINAHHRVVVLEIDRYLRRVYALQGRVDEHPNADRQRRLPVPSPDFLQVLPTSERKPNPRALLDICRREGFTPSETCYVGDSIVRDISMAKEAGVTAVWARYGTLYDRAHWDTLVTITHWTDADVAREVDLRKRLASVAPDVIIDSFSDLLNVFEVK